VKEDVKGAIFLSRRLESVVGGTTDHQVGRKIIIVKPEEGDNGIRHKKET